MSNRSEDIERDIEATRRDMSRTAAEIERRLQPEHMLDSALGWVQGNPRGRALLDEVGEVVARNPLPLALIGVGIAWLAFEATRRPRRRHLAGYEPMRQRLGPDIPADRHHAHVEDGGQASLRGRSPDPDELLGRGRSPQSARDAAEAFRQQGAGQQDGTRPAAAVTGAAVGTSTVSTGTVTGGTVTMGPGATGPMTTGPGGGREPQEAPGP